MYNGCPSSKDCLRIFVYIHNEISLMWKPKSKWETHLFFISVRYTARGQLYTMMHCAPVSGLPSVIWSQVWLFYSWLYVDVQEVLDFGVSWISAFETGPGQPVPQIAGLRQKEFSEARGRGRKPEIKLSSYWQSHIPSESCRQDSFLASASFCPHGPSLRTAAVQPLSLLPSWPSSPQVWAKLSIFFCGDKVSCRPGWPWICCIAKNDLELLVLLLLTFWVPVFQESDATPSI